MPCSGQEKGTRPEDKVQLACALKVKELHSRIMPVWNKRFCVLCGSRMFVFAGSHPKGKPTLVLDLKGGSIEENKSKKYMFCLKVTTPRSTTLLAFETRLEQAKWLERAGKVREHDRSDPINYVCTLKSGHLGLLCTLKSGHLSIRTLTPDIRTPL